MQPLSSIKKKKLNQKESKTGTFWWIFQKDDSGRNYCSNTPKNKVEHNFKIL